METRWKTSTDKKDTYGKVQEIIFSPQNNNFKLSCKQVMYFLWIWMFNSCCTVAVIKLREYVVRICSYWVLGSHVNSNVDVLWNTWMFCEIPENPLICWSCLQKTISYSTRWDQDQSVKYMYNVMKQSVAKDLRVFLSAWIFLLQFFSFYVFFFHLFAWTFRV